MTLAHFLIRPDIEPPNEIFIHCGSYLCKDQNSIKPFTYPESESVHVTRFGPPNKEWGLKTVQERKKGQVVIWVHIKV